MDYNYGVLGSQSASRTFNFHITNSLTLLLIGGASAEECGGQSGGALSDIITPELFEEMLKHRNDPNCSVVGFYNYDAFVTAAAAFPEFGTTGDTLTRLCVKGRLLLFLAKLLMQHLLGVGLWQKIAHLLGGIVIYVREFWPSGYYCIPTKYPCAPGQEYYGRGPIQISYNYNYVPVGEVVGVDLLNNPDLVAIDPIVSFKTSIWFWMTDQPPKPSCHNVITRNWTSYPPDIEAGRLPMYGVIINILNRDLECRISMDYEVSDRIVFYKRYCDMFGIEYGDNIDCANQRPFGSNVGS